MSVTAPQTMEPQKYLTMDQVLEEIHSRGLKSVDQETVEYHLHRTRKMPKPAKYVKRERYWTADQIESFIAAL
ncbi:hypothetical protein K3U93_17630 [Mycobacterium malmoense]|uniref:hypothetical protein n=1 Tax=Mycobacterium malmoense TaxID=1780 RepID=UPI00111C445F|nr:hypothetical protein [Mycobacterium malmoense]QZA16479.1 hypothetical protein K3U93_17630 [Mycobacterium malmoense]UNB93281.1 hypothetical protein H5T25_17615 [Mycobacterium malmoense]